MRNRLPSRVYCSIEARKLHRRICSFSFGNLQSRQKKSGSSADSLKKYQSFFGNFSTSGGKSLTSAAQVLAFCRGCTDSFHTAEAGMTGKIQEKSVQ
jgi:hypothetical protein